MTEDSRMTSDFATVSAVSRAQPVALVSTLQRLRVLSPSPTSHVSLLRQARQFSASVARAAAGASLLIFSLAFLVGVYHWRSAWIANDETFFEHLFLSHPPRLYLWTIGGACMVSSVAAAISMSWFRRRVMAARDAPEAAQRANDAVDTVSIALAIAGATAALLTFSILRFSIEIEDKRLFESLIPEFCRARRFVAASIIVAVIATSLGAAVLARRIARSGAVPSGRLALASLVTLFATLIVVLKHDDGGDIRMDPSFLVRALFTAVAAVSLFGVVATVTLLRRGASRRSAQASEPSRQ